MKKAPFADIISFEWSAPSTLNIKQKGLWTAFLLGPIFGIASGGYMLVIRSVLGNVKTAVFVLLVVAMVTISGVIFGMLT